ncbi:MAG: NifU family protein [Acidobacteriota bacterium]|nr:NifU family protein [Acidobacteriota bacterium]
MQDEIKITGEPSERGDRCKYTVDRPLVPGESAFFGRPLEPGMSALAGEILSIDSLDSVLLAENMVTVSAAHPVDWPALALGNVIRKHVRGGEPIVSERYFRELPSEGDLKWAIGDLLARQINPAVAQHGGFVELIDVKRNNVYLRLGGGCQGCGAADVTLKQGIEKAIRELVPRVGEILDTTDHAAGRNPFYSPGK